jgi:hypothetical protein
MWAMVSIPSGAASGVFLWAFFQQKLYEMWWQESPGLVQEDAVQELQIKAGRLERENEALKNEKATLEDKAAQSRNTRAQVN